jgi:predicted MFS family arabinose efflux permease
VRSTSLGLGVGVAGATGGILVSLFGFEILFILVGVFSMLSVLLLFFIQKDLSLKDKSSLETYPPKDTFYGK